MSVAAFFLTLATAAALWWILKTVAAAVQEPGEFAKGIALSLIKSPGAWAYTSTEYWLENERASVRLCVDSSSFGGVETTIRQNSGSDKLAKFTGADLRVTRKAFKTWKAATAAEREAVSDRLRRAALIDLAA